MITWSTIEDGIATWVEAASGLETHWTESNDPRPLGQYVELSATVQRVGLGWTEYTQADPVVVGAELIETVRRLQILELSLTCYDGGAHGDTKPAAVLDDILHKASVDVTRSALKTAGWVPMAEDPILPIGGVIGGTVFEPRATVNVRGMVNSSVVGTATYIQTAEVENTITGETTILDIAASAARWTELGIVRLTETGVERVTE